MAALSRDRDTPARSGDIRELPVDGGSKIFAGSMAALNAAGFVVPFATATTLKGLGRAEAQVDNTSGADGAVNVRVATGIFRFANSMAGDLISRDDIGADCYGVDDQTVALTSGTNTRSIAGKIFDVDASGVWVKFS